MESPSNLSNIEFVGRNPRLALVFLHLLDYGAPLFGLILSSYYSILLEVFASVLFLFFLKLARRVFLKNFNLSRGATL